MKLLTHNLLTSNVKGVTNGYPLILHVQPNQEGNIVIEDNEFSVDFVRKMLPKLEYSALRTAAKQVGYTELPELAPENASDDEQFLSKLHHCLLNINVMEGELECPESGRKFPIQNGIPNMLLHEDEV